MSLTNTLPWAGNFFVIAGTWYVTRSPLLAAGLFFIRTIPYGTWAYIRSLWALLFIELVLCFVNLYNLVGGLCD